MATLPTPSPEAANQSQQLAKIIEQKIIDAGGWLDFATFMHMALYTPLLGYYSGGTKKFADVKTGAGDFVTAPEISPLFARTLANQVAQILVVIQDQTVANKPSAQADILEIGAGTGQLAADLLLDLQQLNQLPKQYFILEVSDYLRQIQLETLQKKLPVLIFKKVVWLDALPTDFVGLIFGNELLDALPVHLIEQTADALQERGVIFFNGEFVWQNRPLQNRPLQNNTENAVNLHDYVSAYSLPAGYLSEACLSATGLMNSFENCIKQGVILMLDYGFGAAEYYHPQRNTGTLMCHYQHYAHTNPLINVGLQDITAHVNFTQIAEVALARDLTLAGYCNQASFLMNCGILDILSETSPNDMAAYAPLAAAAQKLLSPAEMGELFKVIAFTKNLNIDLISFKSGDKAHML